jgi:light-regulated signal transduction histidine kinase (bacteriophytochrome)
VLGHDLRTPLGAIITAAQLLELHGGDELTRDVVAHTLSSGRRMNRLIDDMLDFARARLAGGIPLNRAPADLGALVQRAAQEHQASFPERRIEVHCRGDLTGNWDADRLAQVVSNIIGNALQHGRDGEPVQVRIDGSSRDTVTWAVVNAGAIEPELLPTVFDPFRGGRRQRGRHDGLGLGSISRSRSCTHTTDASRPTRRTIRTPCFSSPCLDDPATSDLSGALAVSREDQRVQWMARSTRSRNVRLIGSCAPPFSSSVKSPCVSGTSSAIRSMRTIAERWILTN